MEIKNKQLHLAILSLKKPFKHGSKTRDHNETLFIELTDSQGNKGYGESLPREYVTGENADAVYKNLAHYLKKLPNKFNSLEEISNFLNDLESKSSRNMASLCGLDMALLDLYSKSKNQSVSQILMAEKNYRNNSEPKITSGPLGLNTPAWKKELYCLMGIRDIKLKITPDTNPKRINRIGSGYLKPNTFRLDGNCSLNKSQLISLLKNVDVKIDYIEQAFPTDKESKAYGIKTLADESLVSLEDAKNINFDAASIRIGKNGGILRTLDIIRQWEERSKPYMFGSLIGETSLLSAAQLHIASITNPFLIEGCYSTRLLSTDPTDIHPNVRFRGKVKFDYSKPGLGVNLDLSHKNIRNLD